MANIAKLYLLLAISHLFQTTAVLSQTKRAFEIQGKIVGLPEGHVIYLVQNKATGGTDTISKKVAAKNGSFTIKATLTNEGEPFFIKFKDINTIRHKPITPDKHILILADGENILINGDIDDLSYAGIKTIGSVTTEEYRNFKIQNSILIDEINNLTRNLLLQYNKAQGDMKLFAIEREEKITPTKIRQSKMITDWIQSHPNSMLTPWIIMNYIDSLPIMEKIWATLSIDSQSSYYGLKLREHISKEKRVSIGQIAPSFDILLPNGEKTDLQKITAKGKYTILYFWASWCSPCKSSLPTLKQIYSKYQDAGVNIVSYSVDKIEEKWKQAIFEDNISWYHTIDHHTFAKLQYGVNEIPQYFILDNKGKIIEKPINSKVLFDKVNQLMQ